jgi:hypothetical protein
MSSIRISSVLFAGMCAAALSAAWSCGSSGDNVDAGAGTQGAGAGSSGTQSGTGSGTGGGTMVNCGFESLKVAPADQAVKLDGGTPTSITFTLTGKPKGGSEGPVDPSIVQWKAERADDTPPGTIKNGVLDPYPFAAGVVTVTATDGCVSSKATVNFSLDAKVGDPGPNATTWDSAMVVTDMPPVVVYPSDQTRFPRNIYRQLFQWRTAGYKQFRLTFKGTSSTVTVFSDGVHPTCTAANPNPPAGCWEADEKAWAFIAASNAGSTATMTLDALDAGMPAKIHRAAAITIGFSKQDVKGAIFYWSTTSAGVRRGRLTQKDPENYVAGKPPTDYTAAGKGIVKCVACHTVSRSGKTMVAPTQSSVFEGMWIYQVTPDAPPKPIVTPVANTKGHGFGTISPDDTRVVVAYGGKMWEVNAADGMKIVDLPLAGKLGTHPDWSPDNTQLAFATGSGDAPGGASIALIPYMGNDTWGMPKVLQAPKTGLSNISPMFSPDGKWIAYGMGKGGHGDVTEQLLLVNAAGGTPIELIAANRVVNNGTTLGQHQNASPTWAPPGDLNWVAFNSMRPYGVVLPQGTQQIWAAAIDLDKAAKGQDASYPAFRIPFQGLAENNHRAFWTLDISMSSSSSSSSSSSGGGGMMCMTKLALGAKCDPLNDCCDVDSICDTLDNGDTYVCVSTKSN